MTDLDIHRETGNLFAVLLHRGDGIDYRWTVNFSDDGGASWVETFYVGSAGLITDIDVAVVDGYCYIAYAGGAASSQARVRRVNASNGSPALFSNDEQLVVAFETEYPEIINDLAICSNQDVPELLERLYVSAIASDGELLFYWDDERALDWTNLSPGITDADRGLDMTFHDRFGSYWLWCSYIDSDHDLSIWRLDLSEVWSYAFSTTVGSNEAEMTSIGAYDGTVLCAYDYFSDHHGVRYHISYNEGAAWYWGILDDTTVTQESPAVCAREGGGLAAVYRHNTNPAQVRFQWRAYDAAWGSVPQVFNDHDPYWNQPSIEYLGDGSYGVLYLSRSGPTVTGAYFDRGSCCVLRGDVDHNGDGPDIGDLSYLVSFMFQSGPPIQCIEETNTNGDDSRPDISDLIYLVEYMFQNGPPPIPCPGR